MFDLNDVERLKGEEGETSTSCLDMGSDEEVEEGDHHGNGAAQGDDDDEVEHFFTPEKMRGYRQTGALGSPSPIKKRCRPGSSSCDFSGCFSVAGDTPLNRSSLTATTSETDDDEYEEEEWPDTDSTQQLPQQRGGRMVSSMEGAYHHHHQQHDDQQGMRPSPTRAQCQRLLWATTGDEEGASSAAARDMEAASAPPAPGHDDSQRHASSTWAPRVIRIPPRNINPFLSQPPAGPPRRSLEIKVPAGGGPSSLGPWTLSRYTLEFEEVGKLGEGRYSAVYKSIRRLDGCAYAVKRLAHRLRSEADRARVLREAFASAALADCPKLVRYYDAWFDDGHLHIQTELCPGGCVDRLAFANDYRGQPAPAVEHVVDWRGDESQLAAILKDVSLALHHMHRRGVAHMDVKPTNILVAQDGSFKLADLGHSIVTDGSMPLLEEGDQRYLSQEILAGMILESLKGRPDQFAQHLKAADIFSLGATMYELASMTRLKPSGPEWHRLRSGQIPKVPGISPRLQSLIQSMLDPQPMRRPTASEVLLTSIMLLVGGGQGQGAANVGGGGQQAAAAALDRNNVENYVQLSELLDNISREDQQQQQQQQHQSGLMRPPTHYQQVMRGHSAAHLEPSSSSSSAGGAIDDRYLSC